MSVTGSFLIEIDGAALAPEVQSLLAYAHVDDSSHQPDLFLLRFRDPARKVLGDSKVKMGSKVKVSAVSPAGPQPEPLIQGEVTALEAEFDTSGTYTVIRGYDMSHRLFRGQHTEAYPQATASDVARKVATRADLEIGTVEATNTVFEHLTQGAVSDWEFLGGLAREAGREIAVNDGKFHFRQPRAASEAPDPAGGAPDGNPVVLQLGTDLLRFRSVVTAAEQVKEVQVRGWNVAEKKALVASVPAATTGVTLPTVGPAQLAQQFGDRTYVCADVPYGSQAEVESAAKALADQIAGCFAQFDGVARGNPKLRANAAVTIDNLGAPFDGKYTITTSRHRYDATSGYTTAFSVTGRHERSLLGLASGQGGSRLGAGVVVAQVNDVADPEDKGRVKLTFPWLSDDYVSDWARTVHAGAGKDRGNLVLPEVGDEVLVAFEQGDLRRPYVLGGLYNGIDTPKAGDVPLIDSGAGAVNRRSWVSRRGHRIELLDHDGRKEGILLDAGEGKLRLELDAVGTAVTLHSDGKVVVEAKQGLVLDAGSGKLELKGAEVSVAATAQLSLKGVTATLESDAQTEVKGAIVKIN